MSDCILDMIGIPRESGVVHFASGRGVRLCCGASDESWGERDRRVSVDRGWATGGGGRIVLLRGVGEGYGGSKGTPTSP